MAASNYPFLTLIKQALAFNSVAAEALQTVPCDIFVDTVGIGFAYPLVKVMFNPKIVSYTHYPTISSDMLNQTTLNQFNNKYANQPTFSLFKRVYYQLLMTLYSRCGYFAD